MTAEADRRGASIALLSLAAILAITASWWALALWPITDASPQWVARTRLVCFGAPTDGLPDAGGWLLLIGQPIGMVALVFVLWGPQARAGFRRLLSGAAGQVTVGVVSAAVVMGLAGVVVRVRDANAGAFGADPVEQLSAQLTRIDDVPPALALVNQHGSSVDLPAYRGKAVLVTFAFGHCQTVCPLVVHNALAARDRIAAKYPERTPAVVVVTLDPWRDTPNRLGWIAGQWGLSGDAHVLSGSVAEVEHVLNRWRIPRVRNERTGDVTHPSIVYVIGPTGRINYVVNGTSEQIVAAVSAL